VSLVDSWPSTLIRSNERLMVTARAAGSQVFGGHLRVGLDGRRAASRKFRRDHPPRPFALETEAHRAGARVRRRARRAFGKASVVQIASAKSRVRRRRGKLAVGRPSSPRRDLVHRQHHADHAGRGEPANQVLAHRPLTIRPRHLASFAASSRPAVWPVRGVGVAGVDDHGAPASPSSVRCLVSSTGAASVPRAAEARGPLVVSAGRRRRAAPDPWRRSP